MKSINLRLGRLGVCKEDYSDSVILPLVVSRSLGNKLVYDSFNLYKNMQCRDHGESADGLFTNR